MTQKEEEATLMAAVNNYARRGLQNLARRRHSENKKKTDKEKSKNGERKETCACTRERERESNLLKNIWLLQNWGFS